MFTVLRGAVFGASDYTAVQNDPDRLDDDVLGVLDSLKLNRPILVGHSIAGLELSSVANKHRNRVAGLVYLDAAYSYAFDNGTGASMNEFQEIHGPEPPPPGGADLASFSALEKYYERVNGFRFPEAELRRQRESTSEGRVGKQRDFPGVAMLMSLMMGTKKYTDIPVPALVVFANPHSLGTWVDKNTDPGAHRSQNLLHCIGSFNRKVRKSSKKWCALGACDYAAGRESLRISVKRGGRRARNACLYCQTAIALQFFEQQCTSIRSLHSLRRDRNQLSQSLISQWLFG